jgi:D-beta-D-heptose 7-phosphate kinase/D-beta-D-heptose 1-phosphate adenosyltransferase
MTQPVNPKEKILAEAALLERLSRPRANSLVFTNGVFDILHRGHVEYLFAARMLGDALIVAINTDASVRRLKGSDRPVNADEDRALVLAGLGCVDYVTFFADDTPQRLIAALLPDVLVKGGDYSPDTIVGRSEVEAAGGKVVVIPFVEGKSTTQTLEKIRGLS